MKNIIEFLRQFRAGPFAIFDFAISYISFYLLAPYIIKFFEKFDIKITKANILWMVLPLSIIFHLLTKQNTPLTMMFLNLNDYYLLKILIGAMVFLGLKGILF